MILINYTLLISEIRFGLLFHAKYCLRHAASLLRVLRGWCWHGKNAEVNPFVPSVLNIVCLTKILIKEGILKKISHDRRTYESAEEKSLS